MGKKVKEYKSGDFIFAKVKGYPAWPARVQKPNGKKYFVYFYGTGETANLSPNMIFDYADNKDKFLTKTVKRRDFNDGVKQIEHDFANKVPLEQVIGVSVEVPPAESSTNDSANDSTTNDTLDDTAVDTTVADETMAEDTTLNATQSDAAVEDSDDTGNLVIDEGKQKQTNKKPKNDVKPKETPVKPVKEPKTPRGKGKKEEPAAKEDDSDEKEKKEEEIVSRSGRKIRPKRYMDEQTEENTTLPSPVPKKRRGVSPTPDKEKDKAEPKEKQSDKNMKQFNAVTQSELEDLKEPFKPEDAEKENILIAYLPSGRYIGIKLFQSRPNSFKSEASRLQWDKQAALNAVTLKMQLEKGHITTQSVIAQLVTDLNLTDEERATLDKERETEEKKSRVQFLKTEMRLIELDAKIKTCLSLEKADTDMCLKLLDDLMSLDIKPLMLLKHPTCLETIKRMRAYVGNTPSWELTETAAAVFTKQAHRIRRQADEVYKKMKERFSPLEGLSFWEYFTNRVLKFKKVTASLNADELLEMIHEPIEMSLPSSHDMKEAVDAANEAEQQALRQPEGEESAEKAKKKSTPAKSKKEKKEANSTSKTPVKRQSSRKQQQEEKEKEPAEEAPQPEPIAEETEATKPEEETPEKVDETREKTPEKLTEKSAEPEKETESPPEETEPEKEENGEVEKQEEEKVVENDAEKVEKTKEKEELGEPRAKRSRESKKTEPPPPRSPAKRKSKF